MIPPEKPDIITLLDDRVQWIITKLTTIILSLKIKILQLDLWVLEAIPCAGRPMLHFLCDAIIGVMYDDNPEPQVLNLEVIGEIGGSMITAG
ncbi:MAG: hypothetical protein EZS28_008774 [Streblomastix strix]|uniref:Uncharacterized protein n=1 Tax=Streblomastix strix TaxID=222440 RepID=A0A5J4WL77_9EUKA|nr:MAG: hypothetical protein EZS28_008774 [Streblomastix strix]